MVPKEIGETPDLEDISFQLKSFLSENELVAEIWGAIPIEVLENKGSLDFLFTTWAHNKPKEYLVLYPFFVDLLRDQFDTNCKLTIVVNDLLPLIIEGRSPQEQQQITDLYLHFFDPLGVSDVRLCSRKIMTLILQSI